MTTLKKRLCFLKPFLTPFDSYFYNNHIRYKTSLLDFSRLITCMCTEVGSKYEKRFSPHWEWVIYPKLARARARVCVWFFFLKTLLYLFLYQSYSIYNFFSRLLALRNIYSGRHWVRNALGMMDCHIHYAIVTVRFCTDIFSRFFALRNTRAGHDGQYWDDSIMKRLLRRRNEANMSVR